MQAQILRFSACTKPLYTAISTQAPRTCKSTTQRGGFLMLIAYSSTAPDYAVVAYSSVVPDYAVIAYSSVAPDYAIIKKRAC